MIKQKQIQERISVPHKHANKIIIRLPNYIGDSIMSTPAIQLLLREYPKAKLTILCRKHTEGILINHPSVNKIIIDYSKSSSNRLTYTLSLIRKIRKEKYDLGILFQNNFINALIFKLSRINTIIGYRNESRRILLDYHIKLDRSQHYVNRYAQLINNFLANKYTRLPQIQIWNKSGNHLINFQNKRPIIALNLGNDTQQSRAYPSNHSLDLIKKLIHTEEFNLILIGDKNDALRAKHYNVLDNDQNRNLYNFTNKTSVSEYINLIKQSDLLITIDSSAMHIAAAVGTPFITILGKSTSPFCTVKPKVNFGIYLKEERNLIDEKQFISQIAPEMILEQIQLALNTNFNLIFEAQNSSLS